ncbi:MAG TPA: T9SS type A sorting domain-containing protein [Bacteroidales bacterium]|nr:T9SS type A sorting domain-containing protein [Bacteroidales bacterium]
MKRNYLFFIALMFSITAIAQIPTTGLIGYWPFSGNANDMSGNGYHGVNNGASLTIDRFGNPYSAYHFNGLLAYIVLNNNIPIINSNSFTISAWAIMDGPGGGNLGQNNIYEQRCDDATTTAKSTILLMPEDHTGHMLFIIRSSINSMASDGTISTLSKGYGAWHHYAGVLDASDTMRLYIDGQEVGKTPFTHTGDFITDIDYVDFGRHQNSGSTIRGAFNGDIDDVRIYNFGLNQKEILSLYQENTSGISHTVNENGVIILPNPAIHFIHIELPTFEKNDIISVLNIHGQILIQQPIIQKKTQIDLDDIAKGIYFIKITTAEGVVIKKFLKE